MQLHEGEHDKARSREQANCPEHHRPSRQVDEHDSIVVGDETHQECNSMKENMMGPDHVSKPNVKLFQGLGDTGEKNHNVHQVDGSHDVEEDRGPQHVGR